MSRKSDLSTSNAPSMHAGLSSSANTIAASGDRVNVSWSAT
jgi:hypothetical protein